MLLGLSAGGSSGGSTAIETVSEKGKDKGKGKGKEKEVSVSTDGKKKRVKKDPNQPKNPGSGYSLFVKDFTLKYKVSNPTAAGTEGFKAASQEWKNLPDTKKEEYNAKAKVMQTDYKKQKEIYDQSKLSGIISSPEVATRVSFSQESLSDNLDHHENTESTKKKDKKKKRSNSESDGEEAGGSDHHEKKKKKKKDKSKDRESYSSNAAVETDDE